ncbi:hypothetical protein BC937DRAFT_90946 [Endogone sp. FLAS-F59071]|nr:hypothetical protein BC937DRAFT_90946 [Endogone sp. FLAS-F59071]|eukprot:RUS16659.1 hypothetical protein BC937DRAFT_90946 [Endogone sp. FLAS-F59071]
MTAKDPSYTFKTPIRRVAIIGAGAAGLISARCLLETGRFEDVTVFERNDRVGGTWIYSPQPDPRPPIPSTTPLVVDPPHSLDPSVPPPPPPRSAIYTNLHTNLPHQIMSFRDDPFPADTAMFPTHDRMLQYLEDFTDRYNLVSRIRFRTEVVKALYKEGGSSEWRLTLRELDNARVYEEAFDAVMVCTGHYHVPFVPDIDGLQEFADKAESEGCNITVMHSKEYRLPEVFKDKVNSTVLVIGNAPSAIDIAREATFFARKVYRSIRSPAPTANDPSSLDASQKLVNTKPEIKRFHPPHDQHSKGTIEFVDGTLLTDEVDIIVAATGYLFSFPFLSHLATPPDVSSPTPTTLVTNGLVVHNLYRYLFYIPNPTLCFIGLPLRIVPLPLCQFQAMLVGRVWSAEIRLPDETAMRSWYKEMENGEWFRFEVEREVAYNNALLAWMRESEVGEGGIAVKSDDGERDLATRDLDDWWVDMRIRAPQLRKEKLGHLGY